MAEILIGKAGEDEWEEAMALAYRTFRKYVADGYTKEGVENFVNFISDQSLYRMLVAREYHLWVAKDDEGKTIGMGTLRSGNHISLLFVDDKWFRKGVGRSLVHELGEYAKQSGYTFLTVNASPYGIPFYHNVGFKDTGEEFLSGGMYVTPMRLDL
jgi:GNAT superfamily N-acetyltransferase